MRPNIDELIAKRAEEVQRSVVNNTNEERNTSSSELSANANENEEPPTLSSDEVELLKVLCNLCDINSFISKQNV